MCSYQKSVYLIEKPKTFVSRMHYKRNLYRMSGTAAVKPTGLFQRGLPRHTHVAAEAAEHPEKKDRALSAYFSIGVHIEEQKNHSFFSYFFLSILNTTENCVRGQFYVSLFCLNGTQVTTHVHKRTDRVIFIAAAKNEYFC